MSTPTREEQEQSASVAKSASIVSLAIATSRLTGLIRERVFASLFGAGFANDAFQIAVRIPNLTRDLFAEGALSSAFVPIFTEYLTTRDRKQAADLANRVATLLILFVGGLCLIGMVASPLLVQVFASSYHHVPGKFELSVHLTRIMFPFLLMVALAAQSMGVLNSCNQFGVPAMASTFFNIGSLVFGLALGEWLGPRIGISPIEGMAYGVVIGGGLQLLSQVPSLMRQGFVFRPLFGFNDPGVKRVMNLMIPAMLGNAAVQINVAVNSNFASGISDPVRGPDGPVSWLNYSFRFMQLPLGLFGVAIASATLPAISRCAAARDFEEFRKTLSRSLAMVLLLTVPSSVGLAVMGETLVGTIYQVGRFKEYDTHQTALALTCYAVGLAGYSAVKVLNPALYALNDARTPMLISFVSVAINFGAAYSLIHFTPLAHAGLALSVSLVATFNALVLFFVIRERIGGIYGRRLGVSVAKVMAASALMGATVWASSHTITGLLGITTKGRFVDLCVSIPLGMTVLYGACRALKVDELELAIQAVAGPLQRKLPFLRDKIAS